MVLGKIQYFEEVAYCQNFSVTGPNPYILPPNLTQRIASMEKKAGIKLFNRIRPAIQ